MVFIETLPYIFILDGFGVNGDGITRFSMMHILVKRSTEQLDGLQKDGWSQITLWRR